MARYGVLPLNNAPYFPRHNGAREKATANSKPPWINGSLPPPIAHSP